MSVNDFVMGECRGLGLVAVMFTQFVPGFQATPEINPVSGLIEIPNGSPWA